MARDSEFTIPKEDNSLPFDAKQQEAIVGYIIQRESFFRQVNHKLKPEWFTDPVVGRVFKFYLDFWQSFNRVPNNIEEFRKHPTFMALDQKDRLATYVALERCNTATSTHGVDSLSKQLTVWQKAQIFFRDIPQIANLVNSRRIDDAEALIQKSTKELNFSRFEGEGEIDLKNWRAVKAASKNNAEGALTTGLSLLDRKLLPEGKGGSLVPGDTTVILAPANIGKCHGKGTELLDFSGRKVRVEDVKEGDMLMGPDGKPRTVLSTTKGFGPLYRIIPKTGGAPWVCNDVHVLSLKKSADREPKNRKRPKSKSKAPNGESRLWKGDVVNIPLNEYLVKSKDWKHQMKLWRASLDFKNKPLPISPYVLGMWLGDGHSRGAELTGMDDQLIIEWERWIRDEHGHSMQVRGAGQACTYSAVGPGTAHKKLREMGLTDNKHIPYDYQTSSRQQRLELLAGLVDTDGYYGPAQYFEITQKRETLAQDIAFVARSLGFKVTINAVEKRCQTGGGGTYYRINITGKLSTIPVRLHRKLGTDCIKDPSVSGFTVEPAGEGDFYGFTLDGDHLYLLSDFTVTHNTTAMLTIARHNVLQGKPVLLVTREGSDLDITTKLYQGLFSKTRGELWSWSDTPEGEDELDVGASLLAKYLTYLHIPKVNAYVEDMVVDIMRLQSQRMAKTGRGYALLVVDYPGIFQAFESKGSKWEVRQSQDYIYRQFVQLAAQEKFHALLAAQTNREGSKINKGLSTKRMLQMEDLSETFGIGMSATNMITLNRDQTAQDGNYMTLGLAKSRSSEVGWSITCKTDFARAIAFSDKLGAIAYKGESNMGDMVDSLLTSYQNADVPAGYLTNLKK